MRWNLQLIASILTLSFWSFVIKLSQLLFNPLNKDSMRVCVIETKFTAESYFVISSAVRIWYGTIKGSE
jgi:hypothetical protein